MPLVHYPDPSIRRDRVSSVRVFGKSLHMLAAGWAAAVACLWIAGLRELLMKNGALPPDLGVSLVSLGLMSGVVLEIVALFVVRLTGTAPLRVLQREEWRHAFWWSFVPNSFLLATVCLMLASAV
jgi:hypothetical protein